MDAAPGQAFIGRGAELDRLAETFARVAAGQARLVVIAGEAGIGKSRLVEAFSARVAASGAHVLSGGCLPLGTGGLPYAPFVEAFRTLVGEVDPGALPALLGPNRAELARLMPEIRPRPARPDRTGPSGSWPSQGGPGRTDGGPTTPAGQASASTEPAPAGDPATLTASDDRYAQVRLFELVLGLLGRLAKSAPVVLVIEDLQWADPSTRDLVAFLARNLRDERVLTVATIRTDEPDRGTAFRSYLAELLRRDRADRIDLGRFGRDEIGRLLEDQLGHAPDRTLMDRTWERSGGNPFYAEQVLAATRETAEGAVPDRLRDVLLARVGAVSEAGQEVLRVASAAGARIDDELLVAVAELPAATVRAALREVVDRQILVPAGGEADAHLVFRHALLKEVIHGELFPGERARRHAGFAAALERRAAEHAAGRATSGPPPTAAELAYHWDAAGDVRRALRATVDAGGAAERSYAFVEAHRLYRRALELWDRVAATDGDARAETDSRTADPTGLAAVDRVDVLVRAAETAILIGEYRTAIDLGRQAIALVDPDEDPRRASALYERQRWYLWEAGDRAAAAASLAEAERLIPAEPPSAGRSRILAHHAGLLMAGGRLLESVPIAEEAITVARAVGSGSDEALALGILGWDLALLGRVDEGVEKVHAALAIADALGGVEGIALGATNLAVLLDRVGRTADALAVSETGWERVRSLGVERTYGGLLLAIAAKAAIALGRWDEADTFLRLGLDRDPVGTTGVRLRIQRGRLDTYRGDLAAAAGALAAARTADEAAAGGADGAGDDRPALLAALADLAAAGGRLSDTRAAVSEGLTMARNGPPDPALVELAATGLRAEADAAAAARDGRDDVASQEARQRGRFIAREVERVAAFLGLPPRASAAATGSAAAMAPSRDGALTALCRAEARRLEARDEPADWLAVGEAFDAVGRPYPAAYARYRAGGAVLRRRGPRPDAAAALRAAHDAASALGARPLVAEIASLAREARLDLRPPQVPAAAARVAGGPAQDLDLTAREVEVLRLMSAGWSNQEIADSLFISRKTASVHASHIFDKLGAGNRVEAAAIAHRLGLGDGAPPPPGSRSVSGSGA